MNTGSNKVIVGSIALCSVFAVGTCLAVERQKGQENWKKTDLPGVHAPSTWNSSMPLSDQVNKGNWVPDPDFSDEFSGTTIDASKWTPYEAAYIGNAPDYYDVNQVKVSHGQLHIETEKRRPGPDVQLGAGLKMTDESNRDYATGFVESKKTALYGYYEARLKAMKANVDSAFWFHNKTKDEWTELDVVETASGNSILKNKVAATAHVFFNPEIKQHMKIGSKIDLAEDTADDFHVYGLDWEPDHIDFYVDGKLVAGGPNKYWHQPLRMCFDAEVAPKWLGLPADSDLPGSYDIDYIRAWKHG